MDLSVPGVRSPACNGITVWQVPHRQIWWDPRCRTGSQPRCRKLRISSRAVTSESISLDGLASTERDGNRRSEWILVRTLCRSSSRIRRDGSAFTLAGGARGLLYTNEITNEMESTPANW